jgi:hypothetical protein
MLRTAQPKGRLYWTLQAFFFSPAPIRPVRLKSKHDPLRHLIRCSLTRDTQSFETDHTKYNWLIERTPFGATEAVASVQDSILQYLFDFGQVA